jgi:hypothetical protein
MNVLALFAASLFLHGQPQAKTIYVEDARYLGNAEVQVTFSYSGGCRDHQFDLEVFPTCTQSEPQQCLGFITEPQPVEDLCERWVTETQTFDLAPQLTQTPTVLNLVSADKDVVHDVTSVSLVKERRMLEESAVIQSLQVTPIDDDLSPQAFGYQIRGKVLLGNNPCQADGVDVELRQEQRNGVLQVEAIRLIPEDLYQRICTLEYNPVYKRVNLEVRGLVDEVDQLRILNDGELNRDFILDI